MTRTLTVLSALTLLPACVFGEVGSGEAATEVRPADGATAFESHLFLGTTVRLGEASEITITCDDNLLDDIITEVHDGVLELRGRVDGQPMTPRTLCEAEVVLPRIDAMANTGSGPMTLQGDFDGLTHLEVTGSGPITGEGLLAGLEEAVQTGSGGLDLGGVDTCSLSLTQSGSGRVQIGALRACDVLVDKSSSGRMVLAGRAELLDLQASGSGGFGDEDFVVDEAIVALSGSGGAELTVLQSVEARLSGSGGVRVHGDPADRDIRETGSGRVRFE